MTDQDAIEIQNDNGRLLRQQDVQEQIDLLEVSLTNLVVRGEAFVSDYAIGSPEFSALVEEHRILRDHQRFFEGLKLSIASEPRVSNKAANLARANRV
jgi:hypothetical protein